MGWCATFFQSPLYSTRFYFFLSEIKKPKRVWKKKPSNYLQSSPNNYFGLTLVSHFLLTFYSLLHLITINIYIA